MSLANEYSSADESGFSFGSSQRPVPQKPSAPASNIRFGNVGVQQHTSQKTAGKDVSQFTVGRKVKHPRFGIGVITATRGNPQNLIISVKFDAAGNKDLAASLAPLEVIGD